MISGFLNPEHPEYPCYKILGGVMKPPLVNPANRAVKKTAGGGNGPRLFAIMGK